MTNTPRSTTEPTSDDLLPIGLFARECGLSASALRFYADSGVLAPAAVDDRSGYRFYHHDQIPGARLLRQLREIEMPLTEVIDVLAGPAARAAALLDQHVGRMAVAASEAESVAAQIRSTLTGTDDGRSSVAAVRGPAFADAVEQVLSATTHESEYPILTGVRVEVTPSTITLVATDRYRLAVRTLARPAVGGQGDGVSTWAGTVAGDDLRSHVPHLRRAATVQIEADAAAIEFIVSRSTAHRCRLLDDDFPDYQRMLTALDPVTTRVRIPKPALLAALDAGIGEAATLTAGRDVLTVADPHSPDQPSSIEADVDGPSISHTFALTTLYPAVSSAIGADLLLEIRTGAQPLTVRSADHGDLTTVVMPIESP